MLIKEKAAPIESIKEQNNSFKKAKYSLKLKDKDGTSIKKINTLANITHKKSSGANNWHTFIKLTSANSTGIQMDCSEEYTTPDNNVPGSNVSGAKLKPVEPMIKINKNKKRKTKMGKGIKPSDVPKIKSMPSQSSPIKRKCPIKRTSKNETGITREVAIDCEMVGVEVGVKKDALARVSIVNSHGKCLYDSFVKPEEPVLDYRTFVSGVRPEDLENAPSFSSVQKKVADILEGRILVGHGLRKDLSVLRLKHPYPLIRDTTTYKKITPGVAIALKTLAQRYLGVTIQEGEHNSIEDAQAAMQLYKMFKKDWEESHSIKMKKKKHGKEKQVVNHQASVIQAMSLMDV